MRGGRVIRKTVFLCGWVGAGRLERISPTDPPFRPRPRKDGAPQNRSAGPDLPPTLLLLLYEFRLLAVRPGVVG